MDSRFHGIGRLDHLQAKFYPSWITRRACTLSSQPPDIFGLEQGRAWVKQVDGMFSQMTRIVVKAESVAVLDFEKRFSGAIEAAMSAH